MVDSVRGWPRIEAQAVRQVALGVAVIIAVGAVVQLLGSWAENPMSATLFGAVAVSLVAPRAGVEGGSFGPEARRRGRLGLLVGAAAAALVAAVVLAAGGAARAGQPAAGMLFGGVESLALAYRDEIWLHGVVVAVARKAKLPAWTAILYAALASACAVAVSRGVTPAGLAATTAAAACFASLWWRTGDAWAPIAGHFVWAWCSDGLLTGDLLDLRLAGGRLASGAQADGAPAIAAACVFATATAWIWTRQPFPVAPFVAEARDDAGAEADEDDDAYDDDHDEHDEDDAP